MLSVIMLTVDEVRHIVPCLDSVRDFADDLLVFDSHSNNTIPELAQKAGARVERRVFDNFPNQRNAAMAAARHDWIFFIDADERADAEVGLEIHAAIARAEANPSAPVLFWIPRKNYIFGKWIRHTGWSPDYQPRVMRRDRVRFDPARPVHELALSDGPQAYLQTPLTHFNYETLSQFRKKQSAYTRFEAQILYREGIYPRGRGLIGQPAREFARRYIALEGYKDGGHGLLLSLLMAYYAYVR
ncbi:MAG: glycosyltransferase family 2 protein, partial [Anaerolineae bacterium]